jgi:hypothetical protein
MEYTAVAYKRPTKRDAGATLPPPPPLVSKPAPAKRVAAEETDEAPQKRVCSDPEDNFEPIDFSPEQHFADLKASAEKFETFEDGNYILVGKTADCDAEAERIGAMFNFEDGTKLFSRTDSTTLSIPPMLGRSVYGPPKVSMQIMGLPLTAGNFNGKLRAHNPNQVLICDTMLEHLRSETPYATMQAPTGSGKTVMLCNLVHALGRRAIFVCRNSKLNSQAIEKGFGVFLPHLKLGLLKGSTKPAVKKCMDCDVIFTTPKTLSMAGLPAKTDSGEFTLQNLLTRFGTTVFDEVHQMGINEMLEASKYIRTKYRIGVTATYRRNDDKIKVVSAVCGELALSLKRKPKQMEYHEIVVRYSNMPNGELPLKMQKWGPMKDHVDHHDFTEKVIRCADRAKFICETIADDLKSTNYKIIVFGSRVDYLLLLQHMLRDFHGIDAGVLWREVKGDALKDAKSKRVILSTRQSGIEGIDDKDIKFIYSVEGYSKSANLYNEQGFGRHRDDLDGDKGELIFKDFIDNCSLGWSQYRTRKSFTEGFILNLQRKTIHVEYKPKAVLLVERPNRDKLYLEVEVGL